MDITPKDFRWQLHQCLISISQAHFVTLDFELSGIPSKTRHKAKGAEDGFLGKQTLQQRYEETKEAAERFQILQVGLTTVYQDEQSGSSKVC
jgi:poly(A)-specific ribonuclease